MTALPSIVIFSVPKEKDLIVAFITSDKTLFGYFIRFACQKIHRSIEINWL